jgi:hypothetical protein
MKRAFVLLSAAFTLLAPGSAPAATLTGGVALSNWHSARSHGHQMVAAAWSRSDDLYWSLDLEYWWPFHPTTTWALAELNTGAPANGDFEGAGDLANMLYSAGVSDLAPGNARFKLTYTVSGGGQNTLVSPTDWITQVACTYSFGSWTWDEL